MGQSTDAILFYGYCWTEETRRPWTIGRDDEHADDDDGDWEARYAKALGVDEPTEEYPETRDRRGQQRTDLTQAEQAIVAKFAAYWDKQRALIEASACEVGTHCSGDCPMPYVAIKASEIRSWRGHMNEVKSLDVGHDWNVRLTEFCETMGIDVAAMRPAWWLVSNWS